MPLLTDREKRVGLRIPVHVTGRDPGGSPFAEATSSLNVSGGGICFESARQLPVGSRVDLRIRVPPALRRHFRGKGVYAVRAVVCRLEHFEGSGMYRVGARFLEELEA
jgi:hypothetical protein